MSVTFASLDGAKKPPPGDAPLQLWYDAVKGTAIEALPIADLAKALRQRIHPAHVVPVALKKLATDPWAGAVFPGELVQSLARNADWQALPDAVRADATKLFKHLREAGERPAALASDELWLAIEAEIRAASYALAPAFKLIVREGPGPLTGKTIVLPGDGIFAIGRAPDSQLMVEGIDRVAVKIRTVGNAIDVVRVGESVLLNGKSFSGSSAFKPGDVLTLGPRRDLKIELVGG